MLCVLLLLKIKQLEGGGCRRFIAPNPIGNGGRVGRGTGVGGVIWPCNLQIFFPIFPQQMLKNRVGVGV